MTHGHQPKPSADNARPVPPTTGSGVKPAPGTGGPAFPQTSLTGVMNGTGMTLRDWFAGQALTGQVTFEGMEGCDAELIAGCAYELADRMLAERTKP